VKIRLHTYPADHTLVSESSMAHNERNEARYPWQVCTSSCMVYLVLREITQVRSMAKHDLLRMYFTDLWYVPNCSFSCNPYQ
jgi:hypothetical protein